jgi:hypothetical protein
MMTKIDRALKGKAAPETVVFVWMQGEEDSKAGGDVYEESLKGLIAQVRGDLKRPDTMFIIGRLSDCQEDAKKPRPFWASIREIQVKVAEADPLGAWVDTDDLNDPGNTLHYNKAGYHTLGERYVAKAVELIGKKGSSKPASPQS